MSGSGNLGASGVYESGDQKNYTADEAAEKERLNEGKGQQLSDKEIEKQQRDQDATLPAKAHGNKPSRGAEIDQELREEDEAAMKKKGEFGPKT